MLLMWDPHFLRSQRQRTRNLVVNGKHYDQHGWARARGVPTRLCKVFNRFAAIAREPHMQKCPRRLYKHTDLGNISQYIRRKTLATLLRQAHSLIALRSCNSKQSPCHVTWLNHIKRSGCMSTMNCVTRSAQHHDDGSAPPQRHADAYIWVLASSPVHERTGRLAFTRGGSGDEA
mgnify:FL=1